MAADQPLTEEQRHPLLTAEGRRLLRWLQEHPHAPRYNHRCGDRLDAAGLQRVRAYERELQTAHRGWRPGELPPWLRDFVAFCLREVPFYRRYAATPDDFLALPTVRRADLSRQPWAFVPDSQPLDDLIVYNTSGTTGHPLSILCHPETSAMYLPLLRLSLASRGVALEGGPGRVAMLLICYQKRTYTFATVSSFLGEAGFCKINLHPDEWRDPADRARFLDACRPEVYTGDPLTFAELARLPLQSRPQALISTALALRPAFGQELEAHFGCPVLDVYSMNECGPIAVAAERGHEILPHDLYVEILQPDDTPCRPGERGEVTVTGGRNPFLPLLRYRTGDWAALEYVGPGPVLVGLEGRPPTVFRATDGKWVNNIDVTWALLDLALPQYALHQAADGTLRMRVWGASASTDEVERALRGLFGPEQLLTVERLEAAAAPPGKVVQYTSDLQGGEFAERVGEAHGT